MLVRKLLNGDIPEQGKAMRDISAQNLKLFRVHFVADPYGCIVASSALFQKGPQLGKKLEISL